MSDVEDTQAGDDRPEPRPVRSIDPDELPVLAALAIVVSVIVVLIGAVLLGAAVDAGPDRWKLAVKAIGLGNTTNSYGTAPLIGAALLFALYLVQRPVRGRRARLVPLTLMGATTAAAWLVAFTVMNVIADMTLLEADVTSALGLLIGDIGTLVVLTIAFAWGFTAVGAARRR